MTTTANDCNCDAQPRLLRKKELKARTGLSTTHTDRLEDQGHFPKRVPITQGTVGWCKECVDAWIRRRIIERTPIILVSDAEWKAMKAANDNTPDDVANAA